MKRKSLGEAHFHVNSSGRMTMTYLVYRSIHVDQLATALRRGSNVRNLTRRERRIRNGTITVKP